jgi:hypothetical protein
VSCSHAAVCSIKPELAAWLANVGLPASPHEAITIVAARLEVSCVHFLVAS